MNILKFSWHNLAIVVIKSWNLMRSCLYFLLWLFASILFLRFTDFFTEPSSSTSRIYCSQWCLSCSCWSILFEPLNFLCLAALLWYGYIALTIWFIQSDTMRCTLVIFHSCTVSCCYCYCCCVFHDTGRKQLPFQNRSTWHAPITFGMVHSAVCLIILCRFQMELWRVAL